MTNDFSASPNSTKLLLIRHGESIANRSASFAGHIDAPLTPEGLRQAELTALRLKSHDIDIIYSSDLSRAYDTASAINRYHDAPLVKCRSLREIYGGNWEGFTYKEISKRFPGSFEVWENDIGHTVCDGGESVVGVCARITTALDSIATQNAGKTVLAAMHALAIRAFCSEIAFDDFFNMKNLPWPENASVTTVTYNDGKFSLEHYADNGSGS